LLTVNLQIGNFLTSIKIKKKLSVFLLCTQSLPQQKIRQKGLSEDFSFLFDIG